MSYKIYLNSLKFFLIIIILFCFKVSYATEINLKKIIELESPWGSSFINLNEIIITEKSGNIKILNLKSNKVENINHNLDVLVDGQGGLLDIIYHKDIFYVSYSENRKQGKSSTSIARGQLKGNYIEFDNIFRAEPPINSGYHFGSRLGIYENYLFASIGERGEGMIAQDTKKHPGSIIRIYTDGSIPDDNPHFLNKKDWLPEIYQIGVRNPQGMSISSFDNKIYISNHGAKGGDWFGEVKKGENYGWKILGWGGTNYTGTKIGPKWKPGFTKAIKYWVPSIAVSAITIYKGKEFKEWDNHALVTSLKDMSLRKLDFKDKSEKDVGEEVIFKNKIGRIRDIQIQPDTGKLFFLSSNGLWKMEKK